MNDVVLGKAQNIRDCIVRAPAPWRRAIRPALEGGGFFGRTSGIGPMPLAFPSHQGLILPLWRRFPARVDGLALCAGAAMPDIVDGVAWPLRGELGQGPGHSLLGLVLACGPGGLACAWGLRRVLGRELVSRLDAGAPPSPGLGRAASSVGLGALSHLLFDLVSHGSFPWLWPWFQDVHVFPAWWYHAWTHVPLPVYRQPYPVAPHTIAWCLLTVLGAVLFVRCLRRAG